MKSFSVWLCLLLVLSPLVCHAQNWYAGSSLDELASSAFMVNEYTGDIRLTFLGDCTLGGEEKTRSNPYGFFRTVAQRGMSYPFQSLKEVTGTDDLTIANLEGILSDRKLIREKKKFNFQGETAYTEILEKGSIEAVGLANNHSLDYGYEGYKDTIHALDRAGIGWFGRDEPAIWCSPSDIRIGFVGALFNLSGQRSSVLQRQVEELRNLGCACVILVMHAGTEYSEKPDAHQKQIVQKAYQCGCDLVVGHHPHVSQGFTFYKNMPVAYSLGNCVFGGAMYPKERDAIILQAVISFEEGEMRGIQLRFYPIAITGHSEHNDFSPRLLKEEDAQRVLKKMEESTGGKLNWNGMYASPEE